MGSGTKWGVWIPLGVVLAVVVVGVAAYFAADQGRESERQEGLMAILAGESATPIPASSGTAFEHWQREFPLAADTFYEYHVAYNSGGLPTITDVLGKDEYGEWYLDRMPSEAMAAARVYADMEKAVFQILRERKEYVRDLRLLAEHHPDRMREFLGMDHSKTPAARAKKAEWIGQPGAPEFLDDLEALLGRYPDMQGVKVPVNCYLVYEVFCGLPPATAWTQ